MKCRESELTTTYTPERGERERISLGEMQGKGKGVRFLDGVSSSGEREREKEKGRFEN